MLIDNWWQVLKRAWSGGYQSVDTRKQVFPHLPVESGLESTYF